MSSFHWSRSSSRCNECKTEFCRYFLDQIVVVIFLKNLVHLCNSFGTYNWKISFFLVSLQLSYDLVFLVNVESIHNDKLRMFIVISRIIAVMSSELLWC